MQCFIPSRMLNIDRNDIFNWSIFAVNNFYWVIICLSVNRATIYKTKYLGIIAFKVFLRSCFSFNSEENGTKFLIFWFYGFPCVSSIIKCFNDFENITDFYFFFSIYLENFTHFFSIINKMLPLYQCLMVW